MSPSSVEAEQAGAMKHRGQFDDGRPQTIDDSVVAVNELSDRLVAKLRNDPSRTRMLLEPLHGGAQRTRVTGEVDASPRRHRHPAQHLAPPIRARSSPIAP